MTCDGCNKPAEFEVYESKQLHCRQCAMEAMECDVQILIRKVDPYELQRLKRTAVRSA